MRSVQIEASAHAHRGSRASVPCVAVSGTPETVPCLISGLAPPTPCLPSLGPVLLAAPLAALGGSGTMKALTPAGRTPARQASPLTPPCRPDIPTPTTRAARWPLSPSPQRHRLLPGFAPDEQARRSFTPNQVRHPTDCRFTSGCSPPRLAATQLPSIAEPATGSGTDLHRADKASSRTHSSRRKPGPMAAMDTGFRRYDNKRGLLPGIS